MPMLSSQGNYPPPPPKKNPQPEEQIDSFAKYLDHGNLIHSVSDMSIQPGNQVGVKINRAWQPHPFISDALTDAEFVALLRQCLSLDTEYPLDQSIWENMGPEGSGLTEDQEKALENKKDFAFYAHLDGLEYRVRGHIGSDYNGNFLNLRILRSQVDLPEDLGFPRDMTSYLLQKKRGLILVQGQTGTGKSTTLAALARAYSEYYPGSKILTLEDPVEYILKFPNAVVSQKQVGIHVTSWTDGLFNAKREQPDLLIVGEMREDLAIRATIDAASSGMLVIATAHADRYDRALDAILEAYSPDKHEMVAKKLSYILRGIIVQQLLSSIEERGAAQTGQFALPSLAYDVFLNTDKTRSAIRSRQWDTLAVNEADSFYSMKRRITDLINSRVVAADVGEQAIQQYEP